jgi:hypothetical protein
MKQVIIAGLLAVSSLLGGCTTYTQDANGNVVATTVVPIPDDGYAPIVSDYVGLPFWGGGWGGGGYYNNGYYRANWNHANWNQGGYYNRGWNGNRWNGNRWNGNRSGAVAWRRPNGGGAAWRGPRGGGGVVYRGGGGFHRH